MSNINMPRCTCGSATPGAHGSGCPRFYSTHIIKLGDAS